MYEILAYFRSRWATQIKSDQSRADKIIPKNNLTSDQLWTILGTPKPNLTGKPVNALMQ